MKQLLVIGSMNMDFVTHLDHMPAVGETILAQGLELVPGGKGANQAYAMGKLGGHATLLGAVGADSQGAKLCDNLASVGVEVSRVLHLEDAATGMAVIGVQPQGDNSIIVLPGANSPTSSGKIWMCWRPATLWCCSWKFRWKPWSTPPKQPSAWANR